MFNEHERYMRYALREAERALEAGEVPVGCVIVHEGEIIGKGHNQRETLQDPTAHAEVLAITAAAAHLGSWRLEDTRMYVTLEPCPMCAGAIILARIPEVYFGAHDPKAGVCGTLMNLLEDERFNHQPTQLHAGLLAEECGGLLTGFFRALRQKGKSRVGDAGAPENSAVRPGCTGETE
ncbi:MAG: nucleoside deaminase [Candidatus Hydrogenedentes bacterium]|nr:nucleoside deaminase [Candidatus Hydrogenedentota bacterium]MBI3118321.1 nucleoside deaminase [Candidatus Hydrogenedentota bacterium]